MKRRTYVGLAGAGLAGFAGCSSSDGGDGDGNDSAATAGTAYEAEVTDYIEVVSHEIRRDADGVDLHVTLTSHHDEELTSVPVRSSLYVDTVHVGKASTLIDIAAGGRTTAEMTYEEVDARADEITSYDITMKLYLPNQGFEEYTYEFEEFDPS